MKHFYGQKKVKWILVIFTLFALIFSISSCRSSKTNKKGSVKTAPITYKALWQKKTGLRLSKVYLSSQNEKVLVVASKKGKAILYKQKKEVWSKDFKGQIKSAVFNKDGSRVLLALEEDVKDVKNDKRSALKQKKRLLLLGDKGQVLSEKSLDPGDGFISIHLAEDGEKILVFYYPSTPDAKNFGYFLLLDSSGKELLKQTFKDSSLLFGDASNDLSRILVAVIFPSTQEGTQDIGLIIGYEGGKEAFRSTPEKGTLGARFLPEKDLYSKVSTDAKRLTLHKWGEDDALWSKKLKYVSDIQVYPPSDILVVRSHTGVYEQGGSSFESRFFLFSSKGKKVWEQKEKSEAFYDSRISANGKMIALFPLDHPEQSAYLFTSLVKEALPQKLPKYTIDVAFSPDSKSLVIVTSKGLVKHLKIK